MTTTRTRWTLAVAILALTLIAWGGRVGLLTGTEDLESWFRIGGSLLIGVLAAVALVTPWLHRTMRPILYAFAAWSVVLWTRSLIVIWPGEESLAFKLVHTVLALGFYALAWLAVTVAIRSRRSPES